MSKQLKPAFTLIELLIVIGVIAILSAGIIIGVRDATRAARETAALVFSTTMKKTMITDMVGEWTFDDETNPGYDSSGKGNNGTLVGPPTWTADGKVRGALEFNGGGDYVSVADDPSLNITEAITIEAWVKLEVDDTRTTIVSKGFTSVIEPYYQYHLEKLPNNELYFSLSIGGVRKYIVTTSFELLAGSWHHIVATYDGTTMNLYKDVTAYSNPLTVSGSISTYDTNLNIGRYPTQNVGHFDGTIDEVRIYDAALEASQIKARYVQGLNKLHADGKINGKEYYQRLTETGFLTF